MKASKIGAISIQDASQKSKIVSLLAKLSTWVILHNMKYVKFYSISLVAKIVKNVDGLKIDPFMITLVGSKISDKMYSRTYHSIFF